MPSMVDVGDDNISVMSESSDLQRARKMYADLQAMSMESNTSQEVSRGLILLLTSFIHLLHLFLE